MDVILVAVAFFALSLYSKSVFSYINLNIFYKKLRVNTGYWKEEIQTSYGAMLYTLTSKRRLLNGAEKLNLTTVKEPNKGEDRIRVF